MLNDLLLHQLLQSNLIENCFLQSCFDTRFSFHGVKQAMFFWMSFIQQNNVRSNVHISEIWSTMPVKDCLLSITKCSKRGDRWLTKIRQCIVGHGSVNLIGLSKDSWHSFTHSRPHTTQYVERCHCQASVNRCRSTNVHKSYHRASIHPLHSDIQCT